VNASGGLVARYTQGKDIDEPLAMLRGSTTSFYDADGLGSITSLSNAAGALAETYTYDSFGNTTNSSGSLTNFFQYTGREYDTETNLYFYRARYYDPSAGRFLSEDPIGFLGGNLNLYPYAINAPVSFRDPSGRLLIGVLVGGVVGGIEGAYGAHLQGGSTSDVIWSGLIGAAGGAAVGLIDPTEGVATVGEIALVGGGAGLVGDIVGQGIANRGKPCKDFNIGEAAGAAAAGAAGGAMGATMAVGASTVGAGELGQSLIGAGISAAPSTLLGPTGAALGPTVSFGKGCECQK
jgi:RHS repeat-associated protein